MPHWVQGFGFSWFQVKFTGIASICCGDHLSFLLLVGLLSAIETHHGDQPTGKNLCFVVLADITWVGVFLFMYHWLHELLQLVVLRNIEPSMVKHSFTSNFIWCMSSLEKFSSCDIWSRDDKLKPVIDSKFTINILWERERERINKAYSRIVKGSYTIFLTLSLTTLKLKGSYVDEKNKVSNGQTCDGTKRVGPVHLIRSKGLELACCSRLLLKSTGSRQLLCHDSFFLSRDIWG